MPLRKTVLIPIEPAVELLAETTAFSTSALGLLPIPYVRQEQTNWCWAACCAMLLHFFRKPPLSQCDMATRQFGGNCCAQPGSGTCNQPCWPEDAYPDHGIEVDLTESSLAQAALDQELRTRPVEIYFEWKKGGSHVALVSGKHANGDYEVLDPKHGDGPRTYDQIRKGYGLGAWTMTYRVRGA